MPTKDTTVRGVRWPDDVIAEVNKRAWKRKMTFNAWVVNAVKQALRKR